MKENNHGKLVGCRNAANFVPARAHRGDGNASTAPIRHSHWGPVPLAALAQRKADQGGCGSRTHLPSGRWLGTGDPSAISQFVALHFWGNWQAYIPFAVWADSRTLEDPDGAVYIKQWMESVEHDGSSKPAAVATDYQSGNGKGNGKNGGTLDGTDFPLNNKCNKTLRDIDLHYTTSNTPTRQLFSNNFLMPHSKPTPALCTMEDTIALQDKVDTEKTARIKALRSRFEAAARQLLQAGDKKITWSSSTEASIGQGDVIGVPPHYARRTPHAASGKQEKLAARLTTAERDSAAANACVASLGSNQGGPDRTLLAQDAPPPNEPEDPIDGTSKNPIRESPSPRGPEDSSDGAGASSATSATPSSTPRSHVSLSSHGAQMISDIAAVRQDSCRACGPTPVLDGTPSLLTNWSVSATTTSSFSGWSSLNTSKYPLVSHGQLPVNECGDEHQADMFSMDHRISWR